MSLRYFFQVFFFQTFVLFLLAPLGYLLVYLPLDYVNNTPNLSQSEIFWGAVVPIGLFALLVMTGITGGIWLTTARRRAWLDAAFEPLGGDEGLVGESLGLRGVRYGGILPDGRELTVTFQRGPWVEWELSTAVDNSQKLGITQDNRASTKVSGLSRREPLKVPGGGWDALKLYAVVDDRKGGRKLLKDTAVQNALNTLLNHDNPFLIRQVLLHEGTFIYRLYRHKNLFQYHISPAEAEEWLAALLLFAEKAEEMLRSEK